VVVAAVEVVAVAVAAGDGELATAELVVAVVVVEYGQDVEKMVVDEGFASGLG
jgi:hypothetical protein